MMKQMAGWLVWVVGWGCVVWAAPCPEEGPGRSPNPIVRHMFTADPSAHVWADGRLYVYPSTDVAPPRGCDRMDGYHVFSTDDMIHWTDHGEILHSRDVEWGRKEGGFMWAPDCAFKDGTYYYYFPHPSDTDFRKSWKIGIATSTNPASGFVVRGYLHGLDPYIDPCVFIDDDGQAYFYHGGSQRCFGGKLKDSMVEIDGEMQEMVGLDKFHEGAWVFKRNGIYYMIYPDNTQPCNAMLYAMSNHPLGPWESKGVLMEPVSSDTMHGSVVKYKGQWYIFYHNAALSGGITNLRSICFDKLFFNKDGSIRMVEKTQPLEEAATKRTGNLVKNGSFERGTKYFIYGWKTSTTNLSRSAECAVDGKMALKYRGSGTEPVAQRIKIFPDTEYVVSVFINADGAESGAVIFDTGDLFDDTCQFIVQAGESKGWICKTGTFNSGKNSAVNLRCFTSGDFDGVCYWDNITLNKATTH